MGFQKNTLKPNDLKYRFEKRSLLGLLFVLKLYARIIQGDHQLLSLVIGFPMLNFANPKRHSWRSHMKLIFGTELRVALLTKITFSKIKVT